ncbi:MAG: cation:proton antiporter [Acidimicrobiia bacterium]|nr:cation:proton antiporter [Acidimicrobiia bacterium]
MDLWLIVAAFGLGFLASRIGLPPLVGYLVAGFALHALGYEVTPAIETLSDLGILLLLFGIGLKLKPSTLRRPEIWATASIHMAVTTALVASAVLALGAIGLSAAVGLTLQQAALVGFALSFSSTVFAVKALEDRNESSSLAGRVAIGILVMQDIFAVVYLTASTGKLPSPWALVLVGAIVLARPVLGWFLEHSGRGELMILYGFVLAVGIGAEGFEMVGLKPDLGALVVGMVMASHPRASELSDRLLGFKDILLIGFFLSIGLGGTPTGDSLVMAGLAITLLAVKAGGFLFLLPRFRLRARTALHSSISLTTHSEFGLIVAAAGVEIGALRQEWLSGMAVAVAISFVLASLLNRWRFEIYPRAARSLTYLERHPILPEDALMEPDEARIMVFGMGRVGQGAYDELVIRRGDIVVGVDRSDEVVEANVAQGRRAIRGDVLDFDFWERLSLHSEVGLVVLAMSDHTANLAATKRVAEALPRVPIAATARYSDEVRELQEAGVQVARNLYGEAGQGLADDACDLLLDLES